MDPSASPKPLLVYDGDCAFCRLWIDRWRALTEDRVQYAPFQEVAGQIPEISREAFVRNGYGLFAVMTASRPEIIIEGSDDGKTWLDYEFKFKAGDLRRAPRRVEPFQPRLDWQMWFAALGDYRSTPWFSHLMLRPLEGSPPVLDLLQRNPFPHSPPKYVRALIYDYRFTTWAERRERGEWWHRRLLGAYFPTVTLNRSE